MDGCSGSAPGIRTAARRGGSSSGRSTGSVAGGGGRVIQTPQGYLFGGAIPTSTGYLAFGVNNPMILDHAVIATSTDGLRWRLAPEQASLSGSILLAVVERDDGLLAVGQVFGSGEFTPAVWHSTDGLSWERTEDPAGPITGQPVRAIVSDGRLLLRGYVFDGEADRSTSWESLDGVHWATLAPGSDLPDLTGAEVTDPVAVAGRRIVVAGFHPTEPSGP
jgi:hypothetical protein